MAMHRFFFVFLQFEMLMNPIAYMSMGDRVACGDTVVKTIRSDSDPLRLAILGATGSIGRQVIDIVESHPRRFDVTMLSVNTRVDEAVELCERVHPRFLVVTGDVPTEGLCIKGTKIVQGSGALIEMACRDDVDMVVTATVGYSGLPATLAAIEAGKDIALANKETLVVAGDYIRNLLASHPEVRVYPIDSEHSAILQCLIGEAPESVSGLILTASGGPFRLKDKEELASVTAADALKHPNWSMGAKITIDSATMMNKAFEIVEAHYLFGVPARSIRTVVHPQSVVHSMVEFNDGAIKAQLGVPDMHLPIAFALGVNTRFHNCQRLRLEDMATLTFEKPDYDKFPCLTLAGTMLERGGNTACVVNAANEIAVEAFLQGKIRFTDIYSLIIKTLERVDFVSNPKPKDFIETNKISRETAKRLIYDLK